MVRTFDEAINESLSSFLGEWHGKIVDRSYGTTRFGQRFALITTKDLWFVVRLYMDEDHLENRRLHWYELTDHKTLEGAAEHVKERTDKLQSATASLCNYADMFYRYPSHPIEMVVMPSECRSNPDAYLKPGDHILTEFMMFATDEAIYVGNGKVIHASTKIVKENTWENFIGSKWITSIVVQVYRIRGRSPEEIVECAREFTKEKHTEREEVRKAHNLNQFATLSACGQELSKFKRKLLRFVRDASSTNVNT
uniref:Uncharacterized protein n=1 Tax=Plectus sambesii TaxID=2011161 RepID=A0A914XFS0_9BILA